MHSDLSPHLHSEECNAIVQRLAACRQENTFKKFLGACNDIDRELVKCFRRDRETRRRKNKEASDSRYNKKLNI